MMFSYMVKSPTTLTVLSPSGGTALPFSSSKTSWLEEGTVDPGRHPKGSGHRPPAQGRGPGLKTSPCSSHSVPASPGVGLQPVLALSLNHGFCSHLGTAPLASPGHGNHTCPQPSRSHQEGTQVRFQGSAGQS